MLFVFCVSAIFMALLIAQFSTSYDQLVEKAHKHVIPKKAESIQKIDTFFLFIETLLKCVSFLSCLEMHIVFAVICDYFFNQ